VQRETDPRPLAAGIFALGHIDNPLAVPLIASFSSHLSAEVRFAVAFALGCFPDDLRTVPALLRLTEDAEDDVRDWSTFGLGALGNIDSDEIREALVRRLEDPDEDVREEALVAHLKHEVCGFNHSDRNFSGKGADYARALQQRFSL
jgi:HEAT repeat protein